jgi:hypothetical protein
MGAGQLIGRTPASAEDTQNYCVGIQVGSSYAADTSLYLQHSGLAPVWVHFDWSNEYGTVPATTDPFQSIAPGDAKLIVFRTPALGASLQLRSAMPNLQANAVIQRDDGTNAETHSGFLCLGEAVWE